MFPSVVEPRQHPGHWSLGLKLYAVDQRGMWTRQLCVSWAVSLPVKTEAQWLLKPVPVGQDRLWAGEEKATRNGGGPQGATLDSLLKEATTCSKGTPWEGAKQGRGIQGPGLLREWGLDLAARHASPWRSK